ncbi:MAG: hypothetical protein RBR47_07960 [Bacteroidales bacterium]|jgi:hypothetical protein|nr:hypothetical protein [Bacteroidales bacterium]NCU36531.1 hypothetical protein [Candidatus Falkowbacteria bacterium]MDD3131215.1 hypothetical protein [Bacteroidales bacterium]MDD4175525.1 hypothetical protein [Bacteroidales bacterium]MDD4739931.1 hypothetical protein [Bacteroidales bacterium]
METIFRFNDVADLNEQFLSALKLLFKDKKIEISVSSFSDETDYLCEPPENMAFLDKAIQDLNDKKNLVSINGNEYDELVKHHYKKR